MADEVSPWATIIVRAENTPRLVMDRAAVNMNLM